MTSIKVLTYNIHKGFSTGNLNFVLREIREHIRSVDADVVFLQEIQGDHTAHKNKIKEWPESSQFEYLADQIWHHYAYGKNAIYREGHHGNAILSKYPFEMWENINVSPSRRASRSLLHGKICIPHTNECVHVICVHFGLFEFERRSQLEKLVRRIHEHVPDNEPLIIAGDFNDWRRQASDFLLKRLQLAEVFKVRSGEYARSFPSWLPVFHLDRIYFRGLQPVECRVLTGEPWSRLSDHAALYAKFD